MGGGWRAGRAGRRRQAGGVRAMSHRPRQQPVSPRLTVRWPLLAPLNAHPARLSVHPCLQTPTCVIAAFHELASGIASSGWAPTCERIAMNTPFYVSCLPPCYPALATKLAHARLAALLPAWHISHAGGVCRRPIADPAPPAPRPVFMQGKGAYVNLPMLVSPHGLLLLPDKCLAVFTRHQCGGCGGCQLGVGDVRPVLGGAAALLGTEAAGGGLGCIPNPGRLPIDLPACLL